MTNLRITYILLLLTLLPFINHAADYYWIGGTGEWSDISHWATASGGTITHPQVPTSNDVVIFDANSFNADGQTVTFNTDIIFVSNMNFDAVDQNIIVVGGRTVILNVFGGLLLGDNINWDFEGIINFVGDTPNASIDFGNNVAAKELYIAGSGTWNLESNIEIDSIFQINEGRFNTNGFDIRTEYLYLLTDGAKNINLGNSNIEVWGNYGDNINYGDDMDTITAKFHTDNLIWNAGESVITFSAPITEIWFTGNGEIAFNEVIFTSPFGRNYLRPFYDNDPTVRWNHLDIRGRARLDGQHTIDRFSLHQDKIYRLENGRTFIINEISAIGNCARGITITSNQAGLPVNVMSSNTINLDFVTLRDIRAMGSGTFNATNSTDLGNNQNWNFTNSNRVDYYWIGGGGNWTDPRHWSLTSGGPPSDCVPFGKDNAFFDANSFSGVGDTVNVNLEDIFIHNMVWQNVTGVPDLTGDGEHSMHITGSLRLDPNMLHSFEGYYLFESLDPGNTIEMNGHPFNRELSFSGASSNWTLMDDIYVQWHLHHNSGTLITSGNNLDIWKYESLGDIPRHLDMRNSYISFHDVIHEQGFAIFRPEWRVETYNYSSDTEGSTIEFNSVYYALFHHSGDQADIDYNNVVFSSYGAQPIDRNYSDSQVPLTSIDSCIMRARGQIIGSQNFNYLEFTPGYDYTFSPYYRYFINEWNASGTCEDGHITVISQDAGRAVDLHIENDQLLDRLIIQDLHNLEAGVLRTSNSIDQGNNIGWEIDTVGPRILYWVGNTGEWEDESHWSLSSGGMGGECIPTSIDDVIFDENSFDMEYQSVYSDNNRFIQCHNMIWRNVFGMPNFGYYYDPVQEIDNRTDNVKIHGSLTYDPNMTVSVYWHSFDTDEADTIISNGNTISGIQMIGFGTLVLVDDVLNWNFNHGNGTLIFDDIDFTSNYFNSFNSDETDNFIEFRNSNIHIGRENARTSELIINGEDIFLNADDASFYLDGNDNYLVLVNGYHLNKVYSTDPFGSTFIGDRHPRWNKSDQMVLNTFGSIEFSGNGTIYGVNEMDTLIGSAGKTYILESEETQVINRYLRLIGNNCTPIQLLSHSAGNLANLNMPASSNHLVNFVEMRDNNAIGGAEFIAGTRSTDIGMSNRGWLFEDPPEFIETGFLGVDRALCQDSSLVLSAFNFSPNEQYLWSTGVQDTTIEITQTGEYSVRVTFDNGCEIEDQIRILEPQDFQINLGADTTICDGTSVEINGAIALQGVSYIWDDDVLAPIRTIDSQGVFVLSASVDGCIDMDTFEVIVQEVPMPDLGEDRGVCEGEIFTLSADITGVNLNWHDGTTDFIWTGTVAGAYWVDAEINNCIARDSIIISEVSIPEVDLGQDTLLCEGELLELSVPEEEGVEYTWQDNSSGPSYSVIEAGTYILRANNSGCLNQDFVNIDYQVLPQLELGEDITACEGEQLSLASNLQADSYNWNTGSTEREINVTQSGSFNLEIRDGVCIVADDITVTFFEYPSLDFGDADSTICEGEMIFLETSISGTWQDNSMSDNYMITDPGIYHVTLDNNGCISRDSLDVAVLPLPVVDLGEDITVCDGSTATILAPSNLVEFEWEDGSTELEREIIQEGSYIIEAIENGCSNSDMISVFFQDNPIIDLGPDTTVCEDQIFTIIPNVDAGAILWSDGTSSSSYDVVSPGEIIAIADNGCTSADTITIQFRECAYFQIYTPNAISPSSANNNAVFKPDVPRGVDILSYDLNVFDRWGNQMYSSQNIDEGWDGSFSGQFVPPGIYVYNINIAYRDDEEEGREQISGDVFVSY